ncbi:MAG: 5,10-methylenetetrahydromethanopterin reductase [Candidatus Heimdallarchaeota archaeon LC_3]|nr:MAG: 5,10-methylenetetrahydromethanopterin reductase [Candidatus Heimdallarchaeota archaeon LC_3]
MNPFTSHPINIAGNIALIDEISKGRAYIGLAQGAWLNYLELASKHPISALKDAYRCIIHLLNKKGESFESKYFPLKGKDVLKWQIIQSNIPMLLGSWGPQTIKACKPYISEVKFGGTANPDLIPWALDTIDDKSIGIVLGCVTVVDEDGDKARNLARKEVAPYLPIVGKLDPSLSISNDLFQEIVEATQINDLDKASEFIDDELLAKFTFSGTPEEIVAQAIQIFNSGGSRIEFGTPHGVNSIKGIKMLGKEVLPVIREKLGTNNNDKQ